MGRTREREREDKGMELVRRKRNNKKSIRERYKSATNLLHRKRDVESREQVLVRQQNGA